MPDVTVTLTDAQLAVVRRLDAGRRTAAEVIQIHVDTWLAPLVQDMDAEDRKTVMQAYQSAPSGVRATVKGVLGLGESGN